MMAETRIWPGRNRRVGEPASPARGRRSGFEQFTAEHGGGLVKLAYSLCGDRERAEDAVQEALVKVYKRWSQLDDPLAYARTTTINATRDDWRRSARQQRIGAALQRFPVPDPSEPHEQLLQRDALMKALDGLPPRQREVLVLRYGSQLSEAETASVLEISVGTVKSQSNRGLARMRDLLSTDDEHSTREAYAEC
jgi:RNA polymerase sigma-70 factor (sigma-E family)